MPSYLLTIGLLVVLMLALAADIQTGAPLFSQAVEGAALPPEWKPLTFKNISKHNQYALVKDRGVTLLKATSRVSSSGLIRKINIDTKDYFFVM